MFVSYRVMQHCTTQPADLSSSSFVSADAPSSAALAPCSRSPEDLVRKEQEELDLAVALSLQEQYNMASHISTNQGRAWDFVHKIYTNHQGLCAYDPQKPCWNGNNFKVVPTDDLFLCVGNLLDKQAEFRSAGKTCTVDIGFHYTTDKNMLRIRHGGLLTKAERDADNIEAKSLGATFGDGIYTGNNPYSYHKFGGGEQCLFVARLKGCTEEPNPDTVLGRKGDSDEVCVLQESAQCVVLVQFHADLISLTQDDCVGNEMVHAYHDSLQAIVDEWFNGGTKTLVSRLMPSEVTLRVHASQVNLTSSSSHRKFISITHYTAPETLVDEAMMKQVQDIETPNGLQCHICFETLSQSGSQCALLKECSHQFHRACIEDCLKYSHNCPVCRKVVAIDAVQGTMPSGTMRVDGCPFLDCPGFPNIGSIKITYDMYGGVQKAYHINTGLEYKGTVREAYLPDTHEGRALLKRLQYAFRRGLTFTVGTSLSTRLPNSIVWASIHHKTIIVPGPHGFPDPGYFFNANEELDALHVPATDQL